MIDINTLIRPNIAALQAYSSARDEFSGTQGIFLDANENPYGSLNRYPDPYQRTLKMALSEAKNISIDKIFIGNGSDEVIDLLFRIFCEPGEDIALTFYPTYGMYDVTAGINAVSLIKVPLEDDFSIDLNSLIRYYDDARIKLIFLCSPNNPTGNSIPLTTIETILARFSGILCVDEAYIDFSDQDSTIALLANYPNLIVCQTFSKAWGLAAARVGMAFANPQMIQLLNRIKPPYNVSKLNQKAALQALQSKEIYQGNLEQVLVQKAALRTALESLNIVQKVFPSQANFFLVAFDNANEVYNQLIKQKIIVRNRNQLVKNCLRITVGTPEENKQLIDALTRISL